MAFVVIAGLVGLAATGAIDALFNDMPFPHFTASVGGDKPVETEIAGQHFRIPSAYFMYGPGWQVNDDDNSVWLMALYPSLEFRTEENEAEFTKLGWKDTISIIVNRPNKRRNYSQIIDSIIDSGRAKNPTFFEELDLYHYEAPNFEHFFWCKDEDGCVLGRCWPDRPGTYPSCKFTTDYCEGISVQFTFSKRYLEEHWQVRERVLDKIREFHVNPEDCDPVTDGWGPIARGVIQ